LLHLSYFLQAVAFNDIPVTKYSSFQQKRCPQIAVLQRKKILGLSTT